MDPIVLGMTYNRHDVFDRFMQQPSSVLAFNASLPLLTPTEEVALAESIRDNYKALKDLQNRSPIEERRFRKGKRDRDHFIRANIRLIASAVKTVGSQSFDDADLINYGMIGLIEAVDLYDVDLINRFGTRNKFSSVAYWWIRKRIYIALDNFDISVKIPEVLRRAMGKLKKAEREIATVKGYATESDILEQTGWTALKLRAVQNARNSQITPSLDVAIGHDSDITRLDSIAYTPQESDPLIDDVIDLLDSLDESERSIVTRYYGIGQPKALYRKPTKALERALVKLRSLMGAPKTVQKVAYKPQPIDNEFTVLFIGFPTTKGRPRRGWGRLPQGTQLALWDITAV